MGTTMNAMPLIPPDGKISGHRFDDSVRARTA